MAHQPANLSKEVFIVAPLTGDRPFCTNRDCHLFAILEVDEVCTSAINRFACSRDRRGARRELQRTGVHTDELYLCRQLILGDDTIFHSNLEIWKGREP